MSFEAVIVLIVIGVVFLNFVRETFPPDVTAMLGVAALLILGVLSPGEFLGVFSNHAPITVGAMFILSAALDKTGVIDVMGRVVIRLSGASWLRTMLVTMIVVMGLSAFVNNTPVVVIMTPVLLAVARSTGQAGSRLLIPLSYASILGGTCTLIGTSSNLLVDGVARDLGMTPFQMYEITYAGLIMAAAGMTFLLLFGRWLLPVYGAGAEELVHDLRGKRFVAGVMVTGDSDLDGRRLADTRIGRSKAVQVMEILRDGFPLRGELNSVRLRPFDRLLVQCDMDELLALQETGDLHVGYHSSEHKSDEFGAQLVEAIVGPDSVYVNRPIGELDLAARFGAHVLAIHRHGRRVGRHFEKIRLQVGDSLLLSGPADGLRQLYQSGQFTNISMPEARPRRRRKAWIALLAMAGVMILAAFDVMPIVALALIAAVVVVATGCLKSQEAYDSIQWPLLILIFAMLAIGTALQTSGAALLIAENLAALVAPFGPLVVLSTIYLLTSIMTEAMSNNAAVILLTPIAAGLAITLGYDPRPFVVAVMFAGSASFATPIGYQTNTFVYQIGGYKFMDFVRIGMPMNILLWVVATLVIPMFWPLVPIG